MIGARTVSLGHIATERGGAVRPASTYRRLQRFFQFFALDPDWAAPTLAAMLGTGRWVLVLDRTQWAIGRVEVNYLVLAAVTRKKRVPLLWTLLPHRGSFSTEDRIALMQRYFALFPAASIHILLADREFIGADWLKYLNDCNVPFAIRLRGDRSPEANLRFDRVTDEAGHDLTLDARLRRARRGRTFRARLGAREEASGPWLNLAARHLDGEWLIVCSNRPARLALELYRKRWAIECLFGDAKTRGLNIEDTRLTCPRKLALLMAIVALAMAWSHYTASRLLANRSPRRKAHGFYEKSWFRTGFDELRNLLRTERVDLKPLCQSFRSRRVV